VEPTKAVHLGKLELRYAICQLLTIGTKGSCCLSAAHWGVFRTEGFVVAVSDLATGSNLMEFWFVPGKSLVCSLGGLKKIVQT
jgi:hypothetical protein